MCNRNHNRPHVPPGFIMKMLVIGLAVTTIAVAASAATTWTQAADGVPGTAPQVTATPTFPTGLTDEEVAAIEGWNAWFFEREQAYKDAMYEQWRIQMGDDAGVLFGDFEAALSEQLIDLKLEVESLKNTSSANLSAATQLQGYVATPTPEVVTQIVEVPVEVPVIVEVPVEVQVLPTQVEYCEWFKAEIDRQMVALQGNIAPGTFWLIMQESGCPAVLGQ